MSEWNDLYLRTDLSETGPNNRIGSLGSPDIISWGTSPVNPDEFVSEESYKKCYNAMLKEHSTNYFYVRAKNSSSNEVKNGRAHLVLTNPAIIIWPGGDGWKEIKTSSGNDYSDITDVGNGKIGVTKDPFVYTPDDFGHRCVVSWLSTVDHPITSKPPEIRTMDALVKFLIDHPNYCHHNIDILKDDCGKVSIEKPYTNGNVGCDMTFAIEVENCDGYTVGFSCGTPLEGGNFIELKDTKINGDGAIGMTKDYHVPAKFQANITYYYTPGPIKKDNASISFVAYKRLSLGDELYSFGKTYKQLNFHKDYVSNTSTRYFPVGSVSSIKNV